MSYPVIYAENATDFFNLGLGTLPDATKVEVAEERNGEFTLVMTYLVDGLRANEIKKNRIIKVDAGHVLKGQRFVIKKINKQLVDRKIQYQVYAEHVSYITNDLQLKPKVSVSGSGDAAIKAWRSNIIDVNPLVVDSDIETNTSTSWTIDKVQSARQALGGVAGSLLDLWGGEYRFDNYHISLKKQRGTVSNTLLSYGRNITDFDQEENITDTYTSVYPYATYTETTENSSDSESKLLTLPELTIDSKYVGNYPNRKILPVDLTAKFAAGEKPTEAKLREFAKSYVTANDIGVPKVSIKLSFVDLSQSSNYEALQLLEALDLCDTVPVRFTKLGVDTKTKVSRVVWDVLADHYTSMELGDTRYTIGDMINNAVDTANEANQNSQEAQNSANHAVISADGHTMIFYGPGTPSAKNIGDLWYKPDGEYEILYRWDGKVWSFVMSTRDTAEAKDAADKASKEAEEAKNQANKAVDGANDAVSKAGFANDTATQAKSDAAAAGQQAKDALTSAGTAAAAAVTAKNDAAGALTSAKNALTNSSSAQADSAQARKDSATAKIQATNAATQANQAVTDATTAKADANTAKINATQAINDAADAKGQATNALGQANTAINNAANALDKINNLQIGGRNLLLGTSSVKARNPTWKNIINVDVTNLVGTILTYSEILDITDSTQGTVAVFLVLKDSSGKSIGDSARSKDIPFGKADKAIATITIPTGASNLSIIERTNNTNLNPYVGSRKLEKGSIATDWSPAPEDVQQQFTDINGELSQKVSQTTYNVLAGTVDTVNTLAKQNQSTIGTLATKTSVDTVNKTATTAQTLARQNATELLNKASSTTVNTLTNRVTTAESTLKQTATTAQLALTQKDIDDINDTVTTQGLDITAMADGLKLKSDATTVNALSQTVDKQSSQLALTATKAELGLTQTNVDNLKKTVTSNTAGMTANANALKLKADSSTVSSLDGRVTNLSGQLDVQADKIAATVTANDVTGMLNGYATQTWTQSQIKSTADQINLSVSKVQNNLDNLAIGGRNLVIGTSNQVVQANSWNMQVADIKYDKSLGGALCASVMINNADHASVLARGSAQINLKTLDKSGNVLARSNGNWVGYNANGLSWCSISIDDNTVNIKAYIWTNNMMQNAFYSCLKIEKGSVATDWTPAPEDMATEVQFSQLQVTVNGIQGTVQNKADQSQVTQLAGQITSVVGDVSSNSSQITQMKADINLRVKAGDVVNQINISPESILIAGQKVHITGLTRIDNAVIKDAMIADIKADKITAGTLNAANVNVINLNANNITTGTIKGANLSMNLNTGEILFQKGSIRSTNGNLNINIDDGSMSLTNSQGEGAYFIDGKIAMTKNDIWTNGAIHYGQLTFGNNIFGNALGSVSGVRLEGAGGVIVGNKEFNPLTLFGPGKTTPSGGGFAANNSFATLASKGWASIEGGTSYAVPFSTNNPSIVAGVSGKYSAPGAWMPTSDKGPASFVKGKLVGLYAEDGGFSMDHGTTADLAAAVDGRSGYILSAATYARTYASGAQMMVTENGVFGRISSASKYKLAIGEISTLNDEAHQFLSVKPKQWFDKSESEALADTMTTGNTDYIDDAKALPHMGFIAEDLYTAGLDSYVIRDNDGSIESIQYDRLPVLHHELIRELFNRLDAAEMEIYKLKQEVINNAN